MKIELLVSDIHVHLHIKPDSEVYRRLDELQDKMDLTLERLENLMAAIDDLQAAVTAEDTVIDSAITLIQGIPALIAAAGVDPAKLAALQSDITAKSSALAAAVAANTPAAPTT
jgi:Tat protein secretion system quality control protein TatD with DNase activity